MKYLLTNYILGVIHRNYLATPCLRRGRKDDQACMDLNANPFVGSTKMRWINYIQDVLRMKSPVIRTPLSQVSNNPMSPLVNILVCNV